MNDNMRNERSMRENKIQMNRIRRRQERRKNISLLTLTLALVITLSVSISGFFSNAKSPSSDIQYKYYKSIVVTKGESLWSIAQENRSSDEQEITAYVREVMQMNSLTDDNIEAGNYLVIPYYSNEFVGPEA